jgi:hypothetical protein
MHNHVVIFHCPYTGGVSAIRWIAQTWKYGFENLGFKFLITSKLVDLKKILIIEKYKVLLIADIVSSPLEDPVFLNSLSKIRSSGERVALSVFWPLLNQPEKRIFNLKKFDIADIYFGER